MLNIVFYNLFFLVMLFNNWKDNYCERGYYNKYMYLVVFFIIIIINEVY